MKQALAEMKNERWLAAIKLFKLEPNVEQRKWEFYWNLGWCYFKLERFDYALKHMIRAARLAPDNPTCKWGLGTVYLQKKQFKKAEVLLAESLRLRESRYTRIGLALSYLSQGKVAEAESIHLEGLRLKPNDGERLESYAAFLSDVGREREAQKMDREAKKLKRIN